jgi:hypothetical protein
MPMSMTTPDPNMVAISRPTRSALRPFPGVTVDTETERATEGVVAVGCSASGNDLQSSVGPFGCALEVPVSEGLAFASPAWARMKETVRSPAIRTGRAQMPLCLT